MSGKIYLEIENSYVKVGFTTNLKSRAKNYSCHNPHFKGFYDITNGTKEDEKFIHQTFFATDDFCQINNTEWYLCKNNQLLEQIKNEKLSFIFNSVGLQKENKQIPTDDDDELLMTLKQFKNETINDFEFTKQYAKQNILSLIDDFKYRDGMGCLYRYKNKVAIGSHYSESSFYAQTSKIANQYADYLLTLLHQAGFKDATYYSDTYSKSSDKISLYVFNI